MQKQKRQSGDKDADEHELMENLSGMDNPDQGLSTEHEVAREEISDIHSKLIKVRLLSFDITYSKHSRHTVKCSIEVVDTITWYSRDLLTLVVLEEGVSR